MADPKRSYLSGSIFLRPPKRDTWYMRLRIGQTNTMRKIGKAAKGTGRPPAGYFTATTAQAVLEETLAQYADLTPGSDPLFSVAAAEYLSYLERHRGLRASTMRRYKQINERDLLPAFGEKRLSMIFPRDVIVLHQELSERPAYRRGAKEGDEPKRLSGSTLNQTRTLLMGIFKFAKRARGYSGPDPSAEFERSRVQPSSHIEVYSPAEVLALARAAVDEQDAAIFLVAAFAGLRRSELRALRWRDVDFGRSSIFVRAGYTDEGGHGLTKSGKGRSTPMVPQAAKALEDLSRRTHFTAPEDLVFCNAIGREIDGSALYRRFLDAAEKAGLRRLRFHDLRHVFGSLAVQTWPLSDVKAYMGHSDIKTTMIYVHHVPHVNAAASLGALIDADVSPLAELIEKEVEHG